MPVLGSSTVSLCNVIGVFYYPNGSPVANGWVDFSLSAPMVVTATGLVAPTHTGASLDANGNLNTYLVGNDLGTPATSYNVAVKQNQRGGTVFNGSYVFSSTAVNSLSSMIPVSSSAGPMYIQALTAVALSLPSQFTVTGSPVVAPAGTLTASLLSATGSGPLVLRNAPTTTGLTDSQSITAPTITGSAIVIGQTVSASAVVAGPTHTASALVVAPTIDATTVVQVGGSQISFPNLAGTAAAAQLPIFTSTAAGAVPAAGTATTNFLRSDGSWTTPTPSVPTLIFKKGSGAANYTTTSTTYAAIDTTNLAFTTTVLTGWKLAISAGGVVGNNLNGSLSYVGICDGGSVLPGGETHFRQEVVGLVVPFSIAPVVIVGDGNSHSVDLRFRTNSTSETMTIYNGFDAAGNTDTACVPVVSGLLTPSN